MPVDISAEIHAYLSLEAGTGGRLIREAGFDLFCAGHVMPPNNRVTRSLARVVATQTASLALDLGCGTGILALVAARRCGHVVGIDVDPVAAACARGNAARNGVRNVTFLTGDAFVPVRSLRFGLIFSNPPFYPIPGGGPAPEQVCAATGTGLLAELIAGAERHLAPGGRALFITSSLSDNAGVQAALRRQGLSYTRRLLRDGAGCSQDLYLWELQAPG